MKTFKHSDFISISTPVNSEDFKLFQSIVNIGIDIRLEGFTESKFFFDCGRYYFHFHKSEKNILLRRLRDIQKNEDDENRFQYIDAWIEDIKNYNKITN
jgi:hypothetical protein